MKASIWSAALIALLIPTLATALPVSLCRDRLAVDKQPPFTTVNMPDRTFVDVNTPTELRTAPEVLNPEKIILPFDMPVSLSFVFSSGGANWTLGWFYYDDLIARGYVNDNMTPADTTDDFLVDADADGIADFHQDIYNIQSTTSARTNDPGGYIGVNPRCGTRPTFTQGGFTYYEPELAAADCNTAAVAFTPATPVNPDYLAAGIPSVPNSNNATNTTLYDARASLGPAYPAYSVAYVGEVPNPRRPGASPGAPYVFPGGGFSDQGLHKYIPNLLEPAHTNNNNEGIGHLSFLQAEDDGDNTLAYYGMSPVGDSVTAGQPDGIPDYDVSAYDSNGRPVGTNPNPGVTAFDRSVSLGSLNGNRELVFYMVAPLDTYHFRRGRYSTNPEVWPCLKKDAAGQCQLHFRTPVSVFFSKSFLNLDQNPLPGEVSDPTAAARRNIGCAYAGGCDPAAPPAGVCSVAGVNYCGWLDGPALARLNTPAYGNLLMPNEVANVTRPTSEVMPHVLVGAPSTDRRRWILGFEDLNGGGDRDFNDVVMVVNKQAGGRARSEVISAIDFPPVDANEFTITRVKFTKDDESAALPAGCAGATVTYDYFVALDCQTCTSGAGATCTPNPSPRWQQVIFPPATPNTAVMDMLDTGAVGSQLCWEVRIRTDKDTCRPAVRNVDIGYQALRAGQYSQSSVTPVGNALVFGNYEIPGPATPVASTVRTYDNKGDSTFRGNLFFKSLYDPATPAVSSVVQRWNSADTLRTLSPYINEAESSLRSMYTADAAGNRTELRTDLANANVGSVGFPDSIFSNISFGNYIWDVNRSGGAADQSDRHFFKEWMYGWEDVHGSATGTCVAAGTCKVQSSARRAWPMGGVHLSTPAVVGPAGYPSWYTSVTSAEAQQFKAGYVDQLISRPTVAFVGTQTGMLHAVNAGSLRYGDDSSTPPLEYRGYFTPNPACPGGRCYGDGAEVFAYVPRTLLPYFRQLYARLNDLGGPSLTLPKLDASPSVGDVDLGIPGQPAWTINPAAVRNEGAKTVLVSASGPTTDTVFALDITSPSQPVYPLPMWEYKLSNAPLAAFTTARVTDPLVQLPDTRGSRHSPPIVRLDLGTYGLRWVAIVGTDFVPNAGTAATVYLIDVKTGLPLSLGTATNAGIVTLETGAGIAGEPIPMDVNRDGSYEVIYVVATSGKVYRINTTQVAVTARLGEQIPSCRVAWAGNDLAAYAGLLPAEAAKQTVYSNLAGKVVSLSTARGVDFYFATSDNPDDAVDPLATNYYLMGYEDPEPTGPTCAATYLYGRQLPAGHEVWGGVALTKDDVVLTTAVGPAADACNLSITESGQLIVTGQKPDPSTGAPVDRSPASNSLNGHGLSTPVIYDQHLFITTATGEVKAMGGDWNNAPPATQTRAKSLLWDVTPEGRLPQ